MTCLTVSSTQECQHTSSPFPNTWIIVWITCFHRSVFTVRLYQLRTEVTVDYKVSFKTAAHGHQAFLLSHCYAYPSLIQVKAFLWLKHFLPEWIWCNRSINNKPSVSTYCQIKQKDRHCLLHTAYKYNMQYVLHSAFGCSITVLLYLFCSKLCLSLVLKSVSKANDNNASVTSTCDF